MVSRYHCGDPLTSLTLMYLKPSQVARAASRARIAARCHYHQLPIRSSC